MAAAPDIQNAEDAAINLITRLFTRLNQAESPADVQALVDKMTAFSTLLSIIYRIEDQRAKRQ